MIRLFPFKALRPTDEFVSKVASRSTGTEKDSEVFELLENNPFSYLHIVKPYIHFGDIYRRNTEHYPFAKNYFKQLLEQGVLVNDDEAAVYIYQQQSLEGKLYSGIVAGVSVLDYLEGFVKKHENTRTEKEERLVKHIDTIGAVGEPVLVATPDKASLEHWINKNIGVDPDIDFNDDYGNKHKVWKVTNSASLDEIVEIHKTVEALYIADGHHRIAATAEYCVRMHSAKSWKANQMYFMAYIVPEDQLIVKSFHRLLLGVKSELLFQSLDKAASFFDIQLSKEKVKPLTKGEFGLLTEKGWCILKRKDDFTKLQGLASLDVHYLEKYYFEHCLGINNTREDLRISFYNGDTPLEDLEGMIQRKEIVAAFTLAPSNIEEIKSVADNDESMPPKSTWIEPKLLTGMLIQPFK